MLFSLSCLACTERTSQKGNKYYVCGVALPDGSLVELFTFVPYKIGDKIPCTVTKRVIGNSVLPVVVPYNEKK